MNRRSTLPEILDSSRPLRASALVQLSDLDALEREEAARLLPAAPAERRLQLAQRLVDLAEDDATLSFHGLFLLLLDDKDPQVRRLAIEGLWEYEDRSLIEPLMRLVTTDPDDEVRQAAALALGRYVVLDEFGSIRPSDGERVLSALRGVIEDPVQPAIVRGRAIEAAGATSKPWIKEMIRNAYHSDERQLQVSALHAMGRNCDPEWLPALYGEMGSPDPQRRFEAAGAAGQIGDEDAVPYLEELIGDADPEVQEAAISALGSIGGDLAIRALRQDLGSPEPRVNDAIRAAIVEAQSSEGLLGSSGQDELFQTGDEDNDDDE